MKKKNPEVKQLNKIMGKDKETNVVKNEMDISKKDVENLEENVKSMKSNKKIRPRQMNVVNEGAPTKSENKLFKPSPSLYSPTWDKQGPETEIPKVYPQGGPSIPKLAKRINTSNSVDNILRKLWRIKTKNDANRNRMIRNKNMEYLKNTDYNDLGNYIRDNEYNLYLKSTYPTPKYSIQDVFDMKKRIENPQPPQIEPTQSLASAISNTFNNYSNKGRIPKLSNKYRNAPVEKVYSLKDMLKYKKRFEENQNKQNK